MQKSILHSMKDKQRGLWRLDVGRASPFFLTFGTEMLAMPISFYHKDRLGVFVGVQPFAGLRIDQLEDSDVEK